MKVRLFVSDLDGTLLNEEGKISEETAAAITNAQKAGILWLTATGRTWSTTSPILKEAGIKCDFVLLNGGEARDGEGRLMCSEAIEMRAARESVRILQENGIGFEINTEEGDYSTDIKLCSTAFRMPPTEMLFRTHSEIRKIFAFSQDGSKLEKVRAILSENPYLTVTSSSDWNVEITSCMATKGKMVGWMSEYYGISAEEVVVFGDGENDRSMFRKFVHSRAVSNAVGSIREIAEQVIESNAENGVAKEVKRILES